MERDKKLELTGLYALNDGNGGYNLWDVADALIVIYRNNGKREGRLHFESKEQEDAAFEYVEKQGIKIEEPMLGRLLEVIKKPAF